MVNGLPSAVLGRTGLEVTRLGYGAGDVAGNAVRSVTEDQAKEILNAVLYGGINYIDTARSYGRSEEFIGKYISHRRSEYYLATKCTPGNPKQPATREQLHSSLDQSLELLKTDYVDIMQLHGGSVEQVEGGNMVEVLQEMRQQGKVRWIGISTLIPHLSTYIQWGVFDQFMIPYSALEREYEGHIAKAAEAGIGTVIRGGAAQGEPGRGLGEGSKWGKFDEARLDELRQEGESRTAFILRFTLSHPHVHTTVVATPRLDHLHENLVSLLKGPLPPDIYDEARRRLDAVGVKPSDLP